MLVPYSSIVMSNGITKLGKTNVNNYVMVDLRTRKTSLQHPTNEIRSALEDIYISVRRFWHNTRKATIVPRKVKKGS